MVSDCGGAIVSIRTEAEEALVMEPHRVEPQPTDGLENVPGIDVKTAHQSSSDVQTAAAPGSGIMSQSTNAPVAQPQVDGATVVAPPEASTEADVGIPSSEDAQSVAAPPAPTAAESETTNSTAPPLPHVPAVLEVGGDSEDSFDSDSASSTVSLRSSIYQYIEENGRTYHAYNSGKYIMPNDEEEQERLDLQHHLFRMTMDNKLHLAPLSNPQNVLDIATGTALENPSSAVLGTDLSPIQPVDVPPNCRFEIDDAEDEWIYNQKFDFIHGRALLSCFKDNRSIVEKIFDNLNPGGYFELQDPCMPMRSDDGTLEGTALDEWQTKMVAGLKLIGRNLSDSVNWGKYMAEAGFVDVVEKRYFWATSPWPRGRKQKLQAAWCQQDLLDGIHAMSMALFTRVLDMPTESVEILLAKVRDDLRNRSIHAYAEVYVVYGRRPE
ncbi:MAG: hypothetical protein M1818_005637 [Claussenomyces sp. TS43310]|nr:MAG: hypothetical protein M1818_005637 [Claussenomyces sp. TS43310]